MSSSLKDKQSLCFISYGLLEGRAQGRKLKRTLREHGFDLTSDASMADIIIAHSAGTLLLPKNVRASLILLVGTPLKLGQPSWSLVQAVWHDMRQLTAIGKFPAWMSNSLWNAAHFFVHPLRALRIVNIMHHAERDLPRATHGQIIFIANHYDPWPDWQQVPHLHDTYTFVSLAGSHNDVWEHPARYVDIIKTFKNP